MAEEAEKSSGMKIFLRFLINVCMVQFFRSFFPVFFVMTGGIRATVFIGLVLTIINSFIVPILNVLSLPIKFFTWVVGFFLVNLITLWLLVKFVEALAIEAVTLSIGGSIVGWFILSFLLGFMNWLVKSVTK